MKKQLIALTSVLAVGLMCSYLFNRKPGAKAVTPESNVSPSPSPERITGEKVSSKFSHLEAKEITLTFTIRGAKRVGQKYYFNDQPQYDAPGVRTVVVDLTRVPSLKGASPFLVRGKTITATGEATERGVLVTEESKLDIR